MFVHKFFVVQIGNIIIKHTIVGVGVLMSNINVIKFYIVLANH